MLQQHPLSAAFPSMSQVDLAALMEDIRANGQRHPIIELDGQVLDGWHRYQACLAAKVAPQVVGFEGADPAAFVLSANLRRRHLSASQRAAAVAAVAEWAPVGAPPNVAAAATLKPTTIEKAAKAADVSPRTIRHAKVAQAAGLGPAVRDGKISAEQGAKIAKLPEPERAAAVEAGHAPTEREATKARQMEATAPSADEVEAMRTDDLADMAEELAAALAADDKLAAMAEEMKRVKATVKAFESRQQGMASELALAIKDARRWMRRYEVAAKKCTCGACK